MSAGSVDTDPGIGMSGWQDAAGDTAAWQMPDRDAPATRDSRAWTEDPLTSPSFSESSAHSTDSRSYRGSHTRGRGRLDEPGGASDSSAYDRGRDYPAAGAWDDSYDSSREDGWRDSGHQYPSGPLDPLPGQAAPAAESAGGWYSAPTSPGGTSSHWQPPYESRERGEAGYDDGSMRDPYAEPGGPGWPDQHEGGRYDQPPAMAPIMTGITHRPAITATPVTTRPGTARPMAATGTRITVRAAPAMASRATARAMPATGRRSTACLTRATTRQTTAAATSGQVTAPPMPTTGCQRMDPARRTTAAAGSPGTGDTLATTPAAASTRPLPP